MALRKIDLFFDRGKVMDVRKEIDCAIDGL
jgi:hypothetical protein